MKPKEREGGEKQQRGSAAAGGGTRRVDDALRSEAGGVSRRIAFVAARCVAPRAARGVRF